MFFQHNTPPYNVADTPPSISGRSLDVDAFYAESDPGMFVLCNSFLSLQYSLY